MVYAPLEPHESYYVEYEGDGKYRFVYYLQSRSGTPNAVFSVTMSLSLGGVGMVKEEVAFYGLPVCSQPDAIRIAHVYLVTEDMGTPAGALALRSAWNFRTPEGWDTVYSPILNMIERPIAPMLVVRVETDWFVNEGQFRYVMQPGEGITVAQSSPIGQVFFVPREEITMSDCSDEEVQALRESQREFLAHKTDATQQTSYGLPFSPHYLRESRARKP